MKTKNGLQLQVPHIQMTVAGLALALLLNPLAYAAPQQAQNEPPSTSPQSVHHPDDDNAPVPPMPPADPAETASQSSDLLPDSPGAVESAQFQTQPATGAQQQPTQTQTTQQPAAQQPSPPPLPKEPLGTAAAETVPTMGVAASRPAGAALAPAKQRRIRTILIRTGALIGAAAAIGVTMALTEGSPSKPPGAH